MKLLKKILSYLDNYEYLNDFLNNPEKYDDLLTKILIDCFYSFKYFKN